MVSSSNYDESDVEDDYCDKSDVEDDYCDESDVEDDYCDESDVEEDYYEDYSSGDDYDEDSDIENDYYDYDGSDIEDNTCKEFDWDDVSSGEFNWDEGNSYDGLDVEDDYNDEDFDSRDNYYFTGQGYGTGPRQWPQETNSWQRTSKTNVLNNQSGAYSRMMMWESSSAGEMFNKRSIGRVGFKNEYKSTSVTKFGGRGGYREQEIEERFRRITFDS